MEHAGRCSPAHSAVASRVQPDPDRREPSAVRVSPPPIRLGPRRDCGNGPRRHVCQYARAAHRARLAWCGRCVFDAPVAALIGYFPPMATPRLAAAALLLLLLTEAVVSALVLSGLCQTPREWPERAGACAAAVLVLPGAGIISPVAGLGILFFVGARLRTTRKGRKDALTAHAAGRLVRELHLGAVWNAASLPNAMIAQVCFVPLALSETRDKYHGVLLMLLPACLLVTKLLEAQAFKALAACAGVTGPVWAMLIKADAHARTAHAAALAGRAW